MAPSLGRFLAALGLSDRSLESNNMKRVHLMDSLGRIYFDSHWLSTGKCVNWDALLLQAAGGRLHMWQASSASARFDNGSGRSNPLMHMCDIHELLAYLVEHGALMESRNEYGDRPLALAAEAGFEAAVQVLLEFGANPIINNRDELPVLLQAVRAGHEGIVRLMLKHLPDVGLVDPTTAGRALNHAAANGNLCMLQTLLDSGLAIDTPHYQLGCTALVRAAVCGHHAAMDFLLDRGADVNFLDDDGFTPLMLVLTHGQEHSARLLIERGADVNAVSSQGVSALMLTARSGTVAMSQLLLERGAEVNAHLMSSGWTALMSAAVNGNWAVMDVLRAAGAQMDALDHGGASARTLAANAIRPEVMHIMRGEGMSELTRAIEAGSWSYMSALLEVSATAPARTGDSAAQNEIDWGQLLRTALQAGNLLLTRELLTAVAARIDAENVAVLIESSMMNTADVLSWKMLDLLREFGLDIDALISGTNTTWLEFAADAAMNDVTNEAARQILKNEADTGTIKAVLEESMQIALQESIKVALQEVNQAPVHETIQSDIQAAIQAAIQGAIQAVVQETAQQAIQSVIQAAVQAATQVPNAVAMNGLLNAPLARASQYSNTEVEAIVELFLRTGQHAPAAVAGNALEVDTLDGEPQLLNVLAIRDLEPVRIYPEAEAVSDDHSDRDMLELPPTGDSSMVAEDDSTYFCCTPIFGNDCRIMPILLVAGIGVNYYLGQFQQGLSLGKSPWEEYSVFGG